MIPKNKLTIASEITSDIIINSQLDGVLLVDKNGYIIYANQSAEDLFSHVSNTLIGQVFGYPVTPHEIQEIQIIKNAQILAIQFLVTIIKCQDGDIFHMILRDVTPMKKMEQEIIKANKELKTAEQHLKQANSNLENKIQLRTKELEEKNKMLDAYTMQLLHQYEETEAKVKFRIAEMDRTIKYLKSEIKKLKRTKRKT